MGSGSSGMKGVNSLRAMQRISNARAQQSTKPESQNGEPKAVQVVQKSSQGNAAAASTLRTDLSTGDVQLDQKPDTNGDTTSQLGLVQTAENTEGNSAMKQLLSEGIKLDVNQEGSSSSALQVEAAEGLKEKTKTYTLEEQEIKQKEFLDRVLRFAEKFLATPVRDLDAEDQPYTTDCRSSVLTLCKSYFYFKMGQVPYPVIYDYRLEVANILQDCKCVGKLCDILEDGVNRRDFVKEDFKVKTMFYLPLKNVALILLNYSDRSNKIKLEIGTHPSMFAAIVKLINDWHEPHCGETFPDDFTKFLKWCLAIFHNCVTMAENVPMMREQGVIKVRGTVSGFFS